MRVNRLMTATLVAAAAVAAGSTGVRAGGGDPAPAAGGCSSYHDNYQYPLLRCDSGEAVRVLQEALRVVAPGLPADGYFGVATEHALIDYEQIWGLPVDGIVDAQTWSSLTWQYAVGHDANANGIIDPHELGTGGPIPQPPVCPSYRADYAYPIQLCGQGEAIRIAQIALNSTIAADLVADGYYGPATLAAVQRFQQASGLAATGEIDEATWIALTDGVATGFDADGNGIVDAWEVGGVPSGFPRQTFDLTHGGQTWAVVLAASPWSDDAVIAQARSEAATVGYSTWPTNCDAGVSEALGLAGGQDSNFSVSVYFAIETAARQAQLAFAVRGVTSTVTVVTTYCLD